MMQMRDWISGLVGAVLVLLAGLPMFGYLSFLDGLPVNVLRWITFGAGIYLLWNSIVEITNSNIVGWWSFCIAITAVIMALLPSLPWFKFELFSRAFYNIVLIAEGVLLMIATFAMEL